MPHIQGIIVHQTGSPTARSTLNSDGPRANGAHFLIDKDGTIYQTASLLKQTAHVGRLRARCIARSICLRAGDVREFFRVSRRASLREYSHDLDMSRCHAQGRVRFANGDRGEWVIDRARRGSVRLSDGRALYDFCEACKSRVFDEP
jgi:hypothetical protein